MNDFRTNFILSQKSGQLTPGAGAQRDHGALASMHPSTAEKTAPVRRTADRPEDAVPQRTGWN